MEERLQMDIVEDIESDQPMIGSEEDVPVGSEGQVDFLEDEIRLRQKLDSVATNSRLRWKPERLSHMKIPFCRLVPMPMVRPTLASDLTKLEQEFVHGYEEGARVLYVSIADEQENLASFSEDEKAAWDPVWNLVNSEFNAQLILQLELSRFVDMKFFVCDGNHRYIAWMSHIDRLHGEEKAWHISVDSIILDTKGRVRIVIQVMHDINKQTKNSHVKTNLVHTLYRVRKYGCMPLEKFNELLSVEEVRTCQQNVRQKWYSMPLEVFTSFIFKVKSS